jgi:putative transposase
MRTRTYPSDLTDEQWELVAPHIPVYPGGRPRKTSMRDVLDAIFYVLRTGCQWRYLPKDFPPRSTVHDYFTDWKVTGTWEIIHDLLREQVRRAEGKKATPSAGCVDSQSVPSTEGGPDRGSDAHKKVRGRKRHLAVDTLGLLLAVVVTAASADDGRAAPALLRQLNDFEFPRLKVLWADQKYHNYDLYEWVDGNAHFEVVVVSKPEGQQGFVPLPKRWVIERTFAWLKRCRRLSLDRERDPRSSEAMVRVAMIHLMLNRLKPTSVNQAFNYSAAA